MLGCELVIDVGSSFVTVYQKGLGIVLKEPSVAIVVANGKKTVMKAVGTKARKLIGKTVGVEQIVYPFKEGAVVNGDVALLMMKDFVSRVVPEGVFKQKITALIPVCCGLSLAERRAYDTLFSKLGFSESIVVDSPNTVARLIPENSGLVINVGASVTEFAIVASTGIINGCSLNIAGDNFTDAVLEYLEESCALKVGFYTAERIKHTIMSLYPSDTSMCEVTGRDYLGSPKTVTLHASDLYPAASKLCDNIVEVARTMLSYLPPEMTEDVINKGIFIYGGSAELPGLKEYLEKNLSLTVNVIPDCSNAVATGGAKLLADRAALNEILDLKNL